MIAEFCAYQGAAAPAARKGADLNWMEHEIMWAPIGEKREDAAVAAGKIEAKEKEIMKEICKNCIHHKPTYKGGYCEVKKKKTKQQDTCGEWRQKR